MEVYTGGGGLSYPFKTLKCRADIACTEACSYTTTTSPRRLLLCADACHRSWHEIATGWMVRGSNPGGRARFSASVQTGPGTHLASYTEGTGSVSRGYSGRGVALTTHLHLAPRLKKEQICPSGHSWLFQGELLPFTFYLAQGIIDAAFWFFVGY